MTSNTAISTSWGRAQRTPPLSTRELIPADQEVQMALDGEKELDTEFRVLWPDKSIHHIKAKALVQRDASGRPVRMLGTNWDITARKRAEGVLQRAREAAEAADRPKSQFLP